MIAKNLRQAFGMIVIMTILTGFIYTGVITGISQLVMPYQANGSLIKENGVVIGSELIGQYFESKDLFWGRPSATSEVPYNGMASGGLNKSPNSEEMKNIIDERVKKLKMESQNTNEKIPVDLITASASGLDPDISIAAAYYQASRVAEARGISLQRVEKLIDEQTKGRQFFILGEPRVNVLNLNRALKSLK